MAVVTNSNTGRAVGVDRTGLRGHALTNRTGGTKRHTGRVVVFGIRAGGRDNTGPIIASIGTRAIPVDVAPAASGTLRATVAATRVQAMSATRAIHPGAPGLACIGSAAVAVALVVRAAGSPRVSPARPTDTGAAPRAIVVVGAHSTGTGRVAGSAATRVRRAMATVVARLPSCALGAHSSGARSALTVAAL